MMDESVLRIISVDAGTDRAFANVMKMPVMSFDSRGHKVSLEYDLLHRPVSTHVTGNRLDNTTELKNKYILC